MPDRAPTTSRIWGVPIARLTLAETIDRVEDLADGSKASYFVTANLHYIRQSYENPELHAVNQDAAFIVADGKPLVWWSRLRRRAVPERIAGSDLIYLICRRAAENGQAVFFLGAAPGIAAEAALRLERKYPGLKTAGVESPPFRDLSDEENRALVERLNDSAANIVFVAFGQPKGELWIHRWLDELTVPVLVQVGASLDFVAGRVGRAPHWMRRAGIEWVHRIGTDPRRLGARYAKDALFLVKAVCGLADRKATAVGRRRL